MSPLHHGDGELLTEQRLRRVVSQLRGSVTGSIGPEPLRPLDDLGTAEELSPRDSLTVVVVAYQEEEALGPLISELFEALRGVQRLEVVIVNDGSQDRTAEVMSELLCRL